MPATPVAITRASFLQDRHGRTFLDVVEDSEQLFEVVLQFFNDPDRQRRMEESEIHHNRPPLAGVVRELESLPTIDRFLATRHPRNAKRLRQAVGVLVRIIMEGRGWKTTGRKGSLGVRAKRGHNAKAGSYHNTGGLAYWFLRAERYHLADGMPYPTVRGRNDRLKSKKSSPAKRSERGDGTANWTPPAKNTKSRRTKPD